MRKASLILLMVAFATVMTVGTAFAAGVVNTPHDMRLAAPQQGVCSTCHIPHKSVGERLWFQAMGTTLLGTVANLCRSCHTSSGGYAGVLLYAKNAEITVYSLVAHGFDDNYYTTGAAFADMLDGGAGPGGAPGLPYCEANDAEDVKDGADIIQCTSCHNVHDNATFRPFLRDNIRDLCVRCHSHRHVANPNDATVVSGLSSTNAISTWGTQNVGLNNPGTHPVGTDVSGDNTGGGSAIITWTTSYNWAAGTVTSNTYNISTLFVMQEFDNAAGQTANTVQFNWNDTFGVWNLGRHLADAGISAGTPGDGVTGGVVCVSCHAVHGVQDDADSTNTLVDPNPNLLGMAQTPGSDTSGYPIANGGAGVDQANYLCESCHHVDGFPAGSLILNDGTGNYGGLLYPNPGTTAYSHPIDDAAVVNETVPNFPGNGSTPGFWPLGLAAAGAGTPVPICESCHIPHPDWGIMKQSRTADIIPTTAGGTDYILRHNAIDVCSECHLNPLNNAAGPTNHHPIGPLPFAGTALNVTLVGGPVNDDGQIGDNDTVLECSDCHNGNTGSGGSNGAAHNWGGPMQIGLDPDWYPVNNGRTTSDTLATENDAVGMSAICELCHLQLRTAGGGLDVTLTPTLVTGLSYRDNDIGMPAGTGRTINGQTNEFDRHGTSTHFLGTVATTDTQGAVRAWTQGLVHDGSNPVLGFNPTTTAWPNGATTPAWSRWDSTGGAADGDHLVCESCHEIEPDKNAAESKLTVFFFADAVTGTAARPADNNSNSYLCEGCHGAGGPIGTHPITGSSVDRTGTTIDTNTATSRLLSSTAPTSTPNASSIPTAAQGTSTFPPTADYMNCDSCHQVHDAPNKSGTYILEAPDGNLALGAPTFVVRGGTGHPEAPTQLDYTGFCDQCHWYTHDTRP